MSTLKVEIYSDIACPWCYVGKKRFDRALTAFPGDVEVVYRPYQLDPSAPEEPLPHREVLLAKYGPQSVAMDAKITELGAREGAVFDFDRVLENNSLLAHRLLWLAEQEYGAEVQRALKERLLTAHFSEGMDVGDRDQLADAAAAVGIDRDRAAALLTGDEGLAEVHDQIDEARALGVSAVPTFVFQGRYAVQGAQETSTFLQVLEQVSAEVSATHAPASGASCADDSCAI